MQQNDAEAGQFRPAIEELFRQSAGWRDAEDFGLPSLYHYTTSKAFLNIIESGELWFTDFRYQNDFSELSYGTKLFTTELLAREEVENDSRMGAMLAAIRSQFELALISTDMYVFSMCTHNNLLNQWRVYARDVVPISIEVATRPFFFSEEWASERFDVVEIVYDLPVRIA